MPTASLGGSFHLHCSPCWLGGILAWRMRRCLTIPTAIPAPVVHQVKCGVHRLRRLIPAAEMLPTSGISFGMNWGRSTGTPVSRYVCLPYDMAHMVLCIAHFAASLGTNLYGENTRWTPACRVWPIQEQGSVVALPNAMMVVFRQAATAAIRLTAPWATSVRSRPTT